MADWPRNRIGIRSFVYQLTFNRDWKYVERDSTLSPEGRCERTLPMGSTWRSFQFILHWWAKMGVSKTRAWIDPFRIVEKLYCPDGWVGGWVVIFLVLWFSSKSSIITTKMCWFQIWPQKLSTANSSKVMSNLRLKIWSFKANFRGGNQQKIMMVTKDLSSRHKFRKVFKNVFLKKGDLTFKNMKKTESPKMTSKVLYELLIRSYERFKYFSQTWNLTISKNTNVYGKSKHYKKWISAAKDKKTGTSKKELKARLEALIYSFERFEYVLQYE